jgi:hypothetical protein
LRVAHVSFLQRRERLFTRLFYLLNISCRAQSSAYNRPRRRTDIPLPSFAHCSLLHRSQNIENMFFDHSIFTLVSVGLSSVATRRVSVSFHFLLGIILQNIYKKQYRELGRISKDIEEKESIFDFFYRFSLFLPIFQK